MKKEQTNKQQEKKFLKARSNIRCGQSQADKIAAFKKGFFKKDN
jgi:hypothetical protein